MAESLREEMQEAGTVKTLVWKAIMNEIIAAIRRLEITGDLQFILPDDEEN